MSVALCVLVFLSISFEGVMAKEAWTLAKDEDGVRIFLRDVDGSSIQEFKAIMSISTSMDSLLAVMNDTEACPEWVHQCRDPQLIFQNGFAERVTYHVSQMPFPATNRDVLFRSKIIHDVKNNIIYVYLSNEADYCLNKQSVMCRYVNAQSYVRVVSFKGRYTFKPLDNKLTEVTWQQHIEPGGALPDWMVNMLLIDIPHQTLLGMSQLVEKKQYQHSRLKYNQGGMAIGFQ